MVVVIVDAQSMIVPYLLFPVAISHSTLYLGRPSHLEYDGRYQVPRFYVPARAYYFGLCNFWISEPIDKPTVAYCFSASITLQCRAFCSKPDLRIPMAFKSSTQHHVEITVRSPPIRQRNVISQISASTRRITAANKPVRLRAIATVGTIGTIGTVPTTSTVGTIGAILTVIAIGAIGTVAVIVPRRTSAVPVA